MYRGRAAMKAADEFGFGRGRSSDRPGDHPLTYMLNHSMVRFMAASDAAWL